MKILVVGTGYVGLTTAVCLAEIGHNVIGVDVDKSKIRRLSGGDCVIFEPGLAELLQGNLKRGSITFESEITKVIAKAEVIFLCLPTPDRSDGSVDTSAIFSFVSALKDEFPAGVVLVNKSTAPVGTVEEIQKSIGRDDVLVVSNPEFLREGSAVTDFLEPSRIVIGSTSQPATEMMTALYAPLNVPKVITLPRSAELIKYASNAFLATKIAFTNSIANLCELLGADVRVVAQAMGQDPRIGSEFLRPGPGYGGSCFPKDTLGLLHTAKQVDYDFQILESVIRSNLAQTSRVVSRAAEISGRPLSECTIGVWGLTFKAKTDDLRHSPAILVVRALEEAGAKVNAFDPTVDRELSDLPRTRICASAEEAAMNTDLLIVLTDWPEFGDVHPTRVARVLRNNVIYDTRNCLDTTWWAESGVRIVGIGVGNL